jgi:hypothetical protein
MYSFSILSATLSIIAIASYTGVTTIYPATILGNNLLISGMILARRKKLSLS